MRRYRENKRTEAESRNAAAPCERTRAHRLGRCACWLPQRAQESRRRRRTGVCPWPGKVAYSTPQEAAWAIGKHARHKRWRQGLNVYPCPAGAHYHAGRLFDRISAWARAV